MAGQNRTSTLDVDASGFLRGLQREMNRLELGSDRAVLRLAIDVQNRARQLCPVDTGRLRSSIVHQVGKDDRGFYVDVGSNVVYAPFVEFGTFKQPAQPYLRPALAEAVRAGLSARDIAS